MQHVQEHSLDRRFGLQRNANAIRVVEVDSSGPPTYIERGGVSLQHFVNRYIRTRHCPINPENRMTVQAAIGRYKGLFPAQSSELETYLDELLLPKSEAVTE